MTKIEKYKVLDVREGDKPIWHTATHSISSEHYYVFILENVKTQNRECLYLTSERIKERSWSEHHLVIVGDIIGVISETDFNYKTKYKVEIISK